MVLDKQAGSPADVVVNGELIGRGDVLVTGEHFGTRIIEMWARGNNMAFLKYCFTLLS